MDLHFTQAAASDEERAAVDELLGPPDSDRIAGDGDRRTTLVAEGGRALREQRHRLLPALHALQDRIGWISPGALNYVSARLAVPPAEAYGVATFYALLSTEPKPPTVVHVCDDIACKTRGADAICAELEAQLGAPGARGAAGAAAWTRSPCLGLCEKAPAALFQCAGPARGHFTVAPVTANQLLEAISGKVTGPAGDRATTSQPMDGHEAGGDRAGDGRAGLRAGERPGTSPYGPVLGPRPTEPGRAGEGLTRTPGSSAPQAGAEGLSLLRRVGSVDPTSLDAYRAAGGYQALRRAFDLGVRGVIREVAEANLSGRGGAAFSTAVKWKAVAEAPARPHYVVCNADESEPGTFKDRVLMEEDPFAVIEAFTIAGFACGAEVGYLYIRGEYPEATRRLESAIRQARARGLLGADIMSRGVNFDVEIRRGGGAYICGEETALLNSIEGRRGEPRNKPPFPSQVGLFGKPTAINNVETLANLLPILAAGGPEFAATGTSLSTGTRLFCVSGCVERPGVYEVPYGETLGGLLEMAGGVAEGRRLQAILLGGAAGVFVRPDELDMPLTLEGARAANATLGSGVVMVFDETVDMRPILARIAAFFRDESCGQCVPCRVGTVRQEEALHRLLANGTSPEQDVALLHELDQAMRDASICGLGHTAGSAILSAITRLRMFQGAST